MSANAASKALVVHDQAIGSMVRIETLAGLLEALRVDPDGEPVDMKVVTNAAGMITAEVVRLRKEFEAMRKLVPG